MQHKLVEKARELEAEIQTVAFSLLQEGSVYEQAQGLLVVASDVNRLTSRLVELLSGKETKRTVPSRQTLRTRRTGGRYPIFFVSGEKLVKLGKGKQRTAKEYRHEAGKAAFDSVCRWIEASFLSGQKEWQAKAADEDLRGKVPAYQVYLVIAALQAIGVVQQVRRGEYALSGDAGQTGDWWGALAALPVPKEKVGEEQ